MRYYENLFIINPHVEGSALETLMDKIKKELKDAGGNLLKEEELGKKRLAYQIEHQKYGNYILFIFESEKSDTVRKFEDWMEITDDILAHLTVKLDEKPDLTKKSESEEKESREV
ncbi:MAG: 30S ribosomal protein S6 [Fidelibacterota bacterium]